MSYEALIVDQSGPIGTITLNRPEARNALDVAMRRELLTALDEIEANPAARVVILTGAGGHFCAGGDVKNMRQRHTAADALAERHDVRLDLRVLVMEQLSGAAHAGLDFVEDQQQPVRLGQLAQIAQELI